MNEFLIRGNEFYGDDLIKIDFPEKLKVSINQMVGHNTSKLNPAEIENALENPIGSKTIRELVKGMNKRIVITCDDLQRPTPAYDVVPIILKQLKEAGISDNQIFFLGAFGTHHPMNLNDFSRKLGSDIVRKYDVVNHNPFEHFVDLDNTSRGTPLRVNKEFGKADFRIAITGVKKHDFGGAGGSGKSVLPGVAWIDSTGWNHRVIAKDAKIANWKLKGNEPRMDMQEAARKASLDFTVNCVVNAKRETIGVFAGDLDDSFYPAVEFAYKQHATSVPKEKSDIVIINSYPLANHGYFGWDLADASVKEGGTVVNLAYHPMGTEILHYHEERRRHLKRLGGYPECKPEICLEHTQGQFTVNYEGRPWPSRNAEKVMMVSPTYSQRNVFRLNSKVEWYTDWNDAKQQLQKQYGDEASVTIYPCAALQFNSKEYPLII